MLNVKRTDVRREYIGKLSFEGQNIFNGKQDREV